MMSRQSDCRFLRKCRELEPSGKPQDRLKKAKKAANPQPNSFWGKLFGKKTPRREFLKKIARNAVSGKKGLDKTGREML